MVKFESKLERLTMLEQILLSHPEGLRRSEIARRLGIHRSTVSRYLVNSRHILPIWENDGLIGIVKDCYLNNVKLNIHEIMVFHLATRLFYGYTDYNNPHAVSGMRKLGHSLSGYSQTISKFISLTAECIETAAKNKNKKYIEILEKITRAWSDNYWLKVNYYSRASQDIHEYDIAPYFVQPYAVGFSLYVIGYCKQKDTIITLKISRIKKAELTRDSFELPASFQPEKLLKDAWGIWYSDGKPVEVVLKFSPRVAGRVKETVWHRNQSIEEGENGSLFWKTFVAEPLELYPWIRGWGCDVEIIKPAELREQWIQELEKICKMYGKNM